MSKETSPMIESPKDEAAPDTEALPPCEPAMAAEPAVAASGVEGGDTAAPATGLVLSAAEVEALQARAAKADENRDFYLRTAADFENFKKRAARERQESVRYANEALLGKLISVLDNFEIALSSDASAAGESFRAGVALIQSQLRNVLAEAGLEEVDAAGQPFDPNLHEAVAQRESSEVPDGHVMQQMRKGYKYRERLLRPASVVVAKAPAPPASAD